MDSQREMNVQNQNLGREMGSTLDLGSYRYPILPPMMPWTTEKESSDTGEKADSNGQKYEYNKDKTKRGKWGSDGKYHVQERFLWFFWVDVKTIDAKDFKGVDDALKTSMPGMEDFVDIGFELPGGKMGEFMRNFVNDYCRNLGPENLHLPDVQYNGLSKLGDAISKSSDIPEGDKKELLPRLENLAKAIKARTIKE